MQSFVVRDLLRICIHSFGHATRGKGNHLTAEQAAARTYKVHQVTLQLQKRLGKRNYIYTIWNNNIIKM